MNKIEILIIDVLLLLSIILNNKNYSFFFNLLGFVEKAEKIVVKLANRLFSHFLIIIGNVLYNNIKHNNTSYNITNRNNIIL